MFQKYCAASGCDFVKPPHGVGPATVWRMFTSTQGDVALFTPSAYTPFYRVNSKAPPPNGVECDRYRREVSAAMALWSHGLVWAAQFDLTARYVVLTFL